MSPIAHWFLSLCLIAILAQPLLLTSVAQAAEDLPPTYLQAFVGAAVFTEDQMTFVKGSDIDAGDETTHDLSTMPFLGFGSQYAFSEQASHFGLDGTILLGWRSHDSSLAAGNGQARVKLDTDLWLVDLAMGIYAQTIFADSWRIYLAAGPMMIFGEYQEEVDDDALDDGNSEAVDQNPPESSSDSGFGVGGYARVGLEYRLANGAFMGLCMRGITTNLKFDAALDDSGLSGVQGFLTYSQSFR